MPNPAGHSLNRHAWDDLLKLVGLSLTQVAEYADINRSTLSGLVGGHQNASIPTAHKIARAVGCHPATLFPTLSTAVDVKVKAEVA